MVWTGSLSELINVKSLGYCLLFSKCFVNVSYLFFLLKKNFFGQAVQRWSGKEVVSASSRDRERSPGKLVLKPFNSLSSPRI